MSKIANIVETLRYGGSVDSSHVLEMDTPTATTAPTIANWQMNFEGGTLSASCEITSNQPIIGAGMLAYSADGKTYFFGNYCSMNDANDKTTDTTALPSASIGLFDPDTNGHEVMAIVYGEVIGADGKLVPFRQQQNFTV